MDEKKRIYEIARDICQNGGTCSLEEWNACKLAVGEYCSKCNRLAERLYNAGYRKQSVGEWVIKTGNHYQRLVCTACGGIGATTTKFCPNCGARMYNKTLDGAKMKGGAG